MAIAITVLGDPGTGKSFSLRTLPPEKTFYINADKKSLAWGGWRRQYSPDKKNYMKTSCPDTIEGIIRNVSNKAPHINYVVVDTVNSIMSDKEMAERKKKGFDKWMDLAGDIYDLVSLGNSEELREDLYVIFIGHTETYKENFEEKRRIKTNGQKLTKLNVESKSAYTFYSGVEMSGQTRNYFFETQTDSYTTCRTVYGCFEDFKIPNDMKAICDRITEFEFGE